MDELSVELEARGFVTKAAVTGFPVCVKAYARHIGAVIHVDHDLAPDELGCCTVIKGKHHIGVNGNDEETRRRFTVCHEIAHIVLGLPSEHQTMPWWSYAKRSPNEILCDVFASELLLPYKLFKPLVDKSDISLAAVDSLARDFVASTMATGSRFATLIWFEDEEVPEPHQDRHKREEEELGLAELDGVLPWPGKKKRR